jgi:hypothetical protein
MGAIVVKTRFRLESRYLMLEACYIRNNAVHEKGFSGGFTPFACYSVNTFLIRMKFIKAELIARYQVDHDAGAYTQGQPEDIDGAVDLVPGNVPPGDDKITL